MTGSLDMGGNSITNISNPTRKKDVVNKSHVDNTITVLRSYIESKADVCVNKSGDQMTGNLSMGGNNITQLVDPVRDRDAANKSYVNTKTGNKNGGEMLGSLNMNGHIVYGLPIDYLPDYNGGEAVSWRQRTM